MYVIKLYLYILTFSDKIEEGLSRYLSINLVKNTKMIETVFSMFLYFKSIYDVSVSICLLNIQIFFVLFMVIE